MGPTSLWAKLWESSPAMPVSMQRSIFDHTTEAEKALHYLETISSSTLVSQVPPSLLLLVLSKKKDEMSGRKVIIFTFHEF